MPATDNVHEQQRLEQLVGHPQERFTSLCENIRSGGVRTFADVETDFLGLIWCLDQYRVRQVLPRGMGNLGATSLDRRLEGVYRGKGNWFSTVVCLILGNKTKGLLASRNDVLGFSQTHQIDIAWPTRDGQLLRDPLVCCEAKLTGAPGYPGNKGRGPLDDWSNRRKELKFQATDLKLYRQAADTRIDHWDQWRRNAPPSCYSIWAARLRSPDDKRATKFKTAAKDPTMSDVTRMIEEARDLTDTYVDGVGIYAFQANATATMYEPAALSRGVSQRVTSLDTVLDFIAAEIRQIMDRNAGRVPPPLIQD